MTLLAKTKRIQARCFNNRVAWWDLRPPKKIFAPPPPANSPQTPSRPPPLLRDSPSWDFQFKTDPPLPAPRVPPSLPPEEKYKISETSGYLYFIPLQVIGRTPKGAYSTRGRARHLLETHFSEPLLRTLLRTLFYCKTHRRPPSQNPSQNLLRTLLRTLLSRTPP